MQRKWAEGERVVEGMEKERNSLILREGLKHMEPSSNYALAETFWLRIQMLPLVVDTLLLFPNSCIIILYFIAVNKCFSPATLINYCKGKAEHGKEWNGETE